MAAALDYVNCGYCLQKHEDLDEPKVLPCGHIHCLSCLMGAFEEPKLITCPRCGVTCQVKPEEIADADMGIGKTRQTCDTCLQKGKRNQRATGYCNACTKRFCALHAEVHGDVLPDHQLMPIDEYNKQAYKLQPKYCTKHAGQSLSLGCKACRDAICSKCVDDLTGCTSGTAHQAISLGVLIKEVEKKADKMRQEVRDKGEKLFALSKKSSCALSEFDTETEKMLDSLHLTRNEQLRSLKHQYDNLEDQFVSNRAEIRVKIVEFKETIVDVQSKELLSNMQRVDAGIKEGHQTDAIASFKAVERKMQSVADAGLPKLSIQDVLKLADRAKCRDIEIQTLKYTITISDLQRPTSIRLVRTAKVNSSCMSVCSRDNVTFVGHQVGLDLVLEGQTQLKDQFWFSTMGTGVSGLAVDYQGNLYSLIEGSTSSRIRVTDGSGTEIRTWRHYDLTNHIQHLTIAGNKVVIPCISKACVTLYDLSGALFKEIPCSILGKQSAALCAFDNNAVIVSAEEICKVFRLELASGEVKWVHSYEGGTPGGVACYGDQFALVSEINCTLTTVTVLDAQTGARLSILHGPTNSCKSWVPEINVSRNMLIIPRYHEKSVQFYEIK